MTFHLIEPCCGSAAVSLAFLGAKRPLLPYQGSKWRFREGLLTVLREVGGGAQPASIHLTDVGPWGQVAPTVLHAPSRALVVKQLSVLRERNAKDVFDELHGAAIPDDPVAYATQFLFLQRLAYSGKAVGDKGGMWRSPGFNTSSAFGLAATERFGAVRPMVPSLIGVLERYDTLQTIPVTGAREPAKLPTEQVREPTVVYLDPPYAGSTSYPAGDLNRAGVVALAQGWKKAGASVVISEGAAVDELVQQGWTAQRLNAGRKDTSRFRGKQEEWLTLSPAR